MVLRLTASNDCHKHHCVSPHVFPRLRILPCCPDFLNEPEWTTLAGEQLPVLHPATPSEILVSITCLYLFDTAPCICDFIQGSSRCHITASLSQIRSKLSLPPLPSHSPCIRAVTAPKHLRQIPSKLKANTAQPHKATPTPVPTNSTLQSHL